MQIKHIGRTLAAAGVVALLAAGCGSSSSGGSASGGGSKPCDLKLAFFGALTGSAANLGVNIKNGAQLAVNQYDTKNPNCKVTLQAFDSEGDAAKAPGLARQVVADPKIIGVIGPAFSGESEAANPIFNAAGLTVITASATRTTLSTHGWKVFHRALGNDASQGPAAALYIKNVMKATKVFVADDQSAYGAGLADTVKATLGTLVVGTDKTAGEGKQSDFSATITKVKASGATVMFYGGYYTNAGLIAKQLAAANAKVTLVAGDGVKDPGFSKTAGNAAAEGTVVTCPCAPPSAAKGSFSTDYKAAFGQEAGTYSDIAYDVANIFLQGIDAGNTTNDKMLTYVNGVTYQGISNTYKFTSVGELDPTKIIVWAYTFKGGVPVPDSAIPTS